MYCDVICVFMYFTLCTRSYHLLILLLILILIVSPCLIIKMLCPNNPPPSESIMKSDNIAVECKLFKYFMDFGI